MFTWGWWCVVLGIFVRKSPDSRFFSSWNKMLHVCFNINSCSSLLHHGVKNQVSLKSLQWSRMKLVVLHIWLFLPADGGSDGLGDVSDRRQVLPGCRQQSEDFRLRPESVQHQLHRVRTEHVHTDLHPLPGHPHTQVTTPLINQSLTWGLWPSPQHVLLLPSSLLHMHQSVKSLICNQTSTLTSEQLL